MHTRKDHTSPSFSPAAQRSNASCRLIQVGAHWAELSILKPRHFPILPVTPLSVLIRADRCCFLGLLHLSYPEANR